MHQRFFFINPPAEDFSCINNHSAPFGMLRLIAHLMNREATVSFYDFLHPDFALSGEKYTALKGGRYEYPNETIEKLASVHGLKRYYRRYGNSLASFDAYLGRKRLELASRDTLILVNCDFTYRLPGVAHFARTLIGSYGVLETQIVFGGPAATLMPGYLKQQFPEAAIYSENTELRQLFGVVSENTAPAIEVYSNSTFIPFRISRHCPMRCHYCASHALASREEEAAASHDELSAALNEYLVRAAQRYQTRIAVPYDDALLYQSKIFFELFEDRGFQLYIPNGMHLRLITDESAPRLKSTGFQELRFGVETLEPAGSHLSSQKLDGVNLDAKLKLLSSAGFSRQQIHFYILYGLPGQTVREVTRTISALKDTGAKINLCGFSPIPGTALFDALPNATRLRFLAHPELTNNNAVALWNGEFTEEAVQELSQIARN